MTPGEIKDEIARRTGRPRSVVALVLQEEINVLTTCVLSRETCYIGDMFVIRSRFRNYSVINKDNERELVTKLAVNVKPRRPLRRSMNNVNGKIRSND